MFQRGSYTFHSSIRREAKKTGEKLWENERRYGRNKAYITITMYSISELNESRVQKFKNRSLKKRKIQNLIPVWAEIERARKKTCN